ncbi:MAG: hypothetical protein C0508_01590 [Cyanobacteria bacterium PR.023]|nr:hypothetical protein [Cyanobacteria bacterium DS2.008]MBA4073702.1 hypothetical protein [Cyanobacteria bacterium PR.023]
MEKSKEDFMKYFSIPALVLALGVVCNIGSASADSGVANSSKCVFEHAANDKDVISLPDPGAGYYIVIGKESGISQNAMLTVEKSGIATILLPRPFATFINFDIAEVSKILGNPVSSSPKEDNGKSGIYIFDLKSANDKWQKAFQMDIELDSVGKCKSYRLRGLGISKPQWVLFAPVE